MKSLQLSLLSLILSLNTYALVDYTGGSSSSSSSGYNPATTSTRIKPTARAQAKATSSSTGDWSLLPEHTDFYLGYTAAKSYFSEENINFINFNLKSQFAHGIFVELGMKGSQSLETKEFEQANSNIKLGFNWLDIGNDYNKLIFDLYVGARLKGKSEISTLRNDRYFGVSTEKRFGAAAIGLGYERVFTDNIEDESEMAIGDITHLKADLGIMVSREIQFLLTYGEVKIGASEFLSTNSLNNEIKYSYLMPQMFLKMSNHVRLNLGAGFQVQRPDTKGLDGSLKVWDYPVVYGNSLFAGLNIAI